MRSLELPPAPVLVRASLSGLLAAGAAVVLLTAVAFSALANAGPDWDSANVKGTVYVALTLLSMLAAATGGAVGTWQAAAAGAQSGRAAAVCGAAAPAAAGLLLNLLLADPNAGGLGAGAIGGLAFAAGAALGAWLLSRRLG